MELLSTQILKGVFCMKQIEKMFYDWSDDQVDSAEVKDLYNQLEEQLTEKLGKEKYLKIEETLMKCLLQERLESFCGGFKLATALWKECC